MTILITQSWIRLRALLGKEFLQLLRDPRMRFFVIVPPIVQLFIFGYAATFDVKNANVGVVDASHSAFSRALLSDVTATGHFRLHYFDNMRIAEDAINRSDVRAILRFPYNFESSGAIQLVADGSDSNSALLVVGQLSQALQHSVLAGTQKTPLIEIEHRAWFNPNLEDREYFVPGIIANVVLIATMILTAMTVVREREIGTLERLMVTPLARLEFVVGKMVPVACVGLFDVILVTTVAVAWFGVPFRGDPLALLVGTLLYLMSTLGLGLVISSFSSTQQQAMLLAVFVIMPLVILSGFAFPIRNMPQSVQLITWLDPLRYYLIVIRDIFLKGGGIGDHLFEYSMMLLLGVVALGLSMTRIR
ncbi:MAG: ABC transporter permease [Gammaproteobacteria bacterium]|jgi:ABC-2 type transport system permease protein